MAVEISRASGVCDLPTGYEFISGVTDRVSDYLELEAWISPSGLSVDELMDVRRPFEWEELTAVAIQAESPESGPGRPHELVGSFVTDYFRRFPVPGGSTLAARLSHVGVHPNFRRRGLMSAMVARHLEDSLASESGLSVLSTSNSALYESYGYAPAASHIMVNIPAGVRLGAGAGVTDGLYTRIEEASEERHATFVREVHQAAGEELGGLPGLNRPGWVVRETRAMEEFFWDDSPAVRNGGEPMRIIVVRDAERPRAYARFRRSFDSDPVNPRGMIAVGEAIALDRSSATALWEAIFDLDEASEVIPNGLPNDDHLLDFLPDIRKTAVSIDALLLRIVDVRRALMARQYAGAIDLAIGVNDDLVPENSKTWHLVARPFETAHCEVTECDPSITIDIQDLAAIYLGQASLATLAVHGKVKLFDPGALLSASVAFGWPVAPAVSWRI